MDRFRSVMPVGNELTYKEQIKREQARHKYALTHIRPMINTSNQYTTMPVKVKSKADYLKGKRQQEIDNENRSLLERLALIDSHPKPMYTGFNSYKYGHSLRGEKRHREAKKINTENLKMYKRIVKTNPTMNTRIYIKDYYNSHQVRPAPKYIPPLKNTKRKTNKKGMTRSESEPISNKRNPLYNRAHTIDNSVHFNTSPDILLFNGIKTVSSKDVNIKLWEIIRELDYGYNGTDGVKVVSVISNNNKIQENSIIFSVNQLIHLFKNNELLSSIFSKLLIINEESDGNNNNESSGFETRTSPSTITTVTYSSLHEALNFPSTTDYIEELLNYLISYYIRINNMNILELSEEGEKILDEISEEERKRQQNEVIVSDVINEEDESEYEENKKKSEEKERNIEEEDFDHKVEIYVNRILASVISEENKKLEEEKSKTVAEEEEEEENKKKEEENKKESEKVPPLKMKGNNKNQVKPIKKSTNNNNVNSNNKTNNTSSSSNQQSKQNNKKNQQQQQKSNQQPQKQQTKSKNITKKEDKKKISEDDQLDELSNSFVNSILTDVLYEENERLSRLQENIDKEQSQETNQEEDKPVEEEEERKEEEKQPLDESNDLEEFSNTFVNDVLNTVVQEETKNNGEENEAQEQEGEESRVVDDEKEMIGNENDNQFNDTFKTEFTETFGDTFTDSFAASNE